MAFDARKIGGLYAHHDQYSNRIKIILQQLFCGNSKCLTVCMPTHAFKTKRQLIKNFKLVF
jgi:hypothetical protein